MIRSRASIDNGNFGNKQFLPCSSSNSSTDMGSTFFDIVWLSSRCIQILSAVVGSFHSFMINRYNMSLNAYHNFPRSLGCVLQERKSPCALPKRI